MIVFSQTIYFEVSTLSNPGFVHSIDTKQSSQTGKDFSSCQQPAPKPTHIHNFLFFETCFDMNDSAKLGHCQTVPPCVEALREP